ncbi:MAG: response regulator transcription factor [Elusimicrobium sp.]|uniref:Response regulator transcription factor n=1 Tax=Candidatus Avelusimicrobium gallicola TaxID=2562704 RepID=A0A928DNB3_9BACT|nr:response regulator transcription factor [Elusimicrobium sp.]
MKKKIVLADDHAIVRNGVRAVLENLGKDMEVIAEISNGKDLVEFAQNNKADVYVVDISMPILNGIEAVDRIVKQDPEAKVVMLSMYDDRVSVEKSLKAGAKGFIVKVSTADEIVDAIEEVSAGRFYLCSKVSKYVVQGFLGKTTPRNKRDSSGLTPKEKEVLQLIAEGYSSKDIAKSFNLSLNTIHVHRNNIMKKLGIHKQAELVRFAIKEGIAQL